MPAEFKKISNGVKRILIFSVAYEPLVGGAELAVRNITDRLFNYEFDLITCRFAKSHKAQEKVGNVRVFRVGFGGKLGKYLYPVFAFRLASRLHRQKPYDLVWSIMAAYAGAAAVLFLRRFPGVKYLLTLQEGDSLESIRRRVGRLHKTWQKIFQRADHIQAISRFLASWAKDQDAKCPITVVPNGVDLERFEIKDLKSKVQGGNSKFTIITVSRLVSKNGVDILLKAIALVKKEFSSVRLRIIGSGTEEKKLKKLVSDLGLGAAVEFLGHVIPDQVPKHLAMADIFVRPSRSEGLGTAFLEAMACGLPVIGTPVGGVTDFLKDQETGLLCRVDDADELASKIALLLRDESLRSKLAENGWRLVERKYTWDLVSQRIEAIFRALGL